MHVKDEHTPANMNGRTQLMSRLLSCIPGGRNGTYSVFTVYRALDTGKREGAQLSLSIYAGWDVLIFITCGTLHRHRHNQAQACLQEVDLVRQMPDPCNVAVWTVVISGGVGREKKFNPTMGILPKNGSLTTH